LHAQQPPIIFRDLKPTNVMITPEGTIKLVDFGIARLFKPGKERDTQAFGTPGYSAPEQYGRGQTDARSDIYSLGVLMHHLLTGHDPSTTPFRLPPVNQLNPSVPPYIAAAIARATDNEPSRRFASVIELQQALLGSGQLVNVQPQAQPNLAAAIAARDGTANPGPVVVQASTGMATAGLWIGIISDILMVIAIALTSLTAADPESAMAGLCAIIAVGALMFAFIGGLLSIIALVSPNTAQTRHGRRDAAIGFAANSGAFLLCCILSFVIAQIGS
jgi:serine/threonine-protein kinase